MKPIASVTRYRTRCPSPDLGVHQNDPDTLDKAAIRTGRFDATVDIGYPTRADAARILTALVAGFPGAPHVDHRGGRRAPRAHQRKRPARDRAPRRPGRRRHRDFEHCGAGSRGRQRPLPRHPSRRRVPNDSPPATTTATRNEPTQRRSACAAPNSDTATAVDVDAAFARLRALGHRPHTRTAMQCNAHPTRRRRTRVRDRSRTLCPPIRPQKLACRRPSPGRAASTGYVTENPAQNGGTIATRHHELQERTTQRCVSLVISRRALRR